jgi:hypothetical protein
MSEKEQTLSKQPLKTQETQSSEGSATGFESRNYFLKVDWNVDPKEISREAILSSLNWPIPQSDKK